MTTPAHELPQPRYPLSPDDTTRSSEEGTFVGESSFDRDHDVDRLFVNTSHDSEKDPLNPPEPRSPSQNREEAHRLQDDLAMLQVERVVSNNGKGPQDGDEMGEKMARSRSRRSEPVDEFDAATNPLHERANLYKPPEHPSTKLAKFFKRIHNSSFIIRYIVYITPLVLILLIPLLLGALVFPDATVGGVKLLWFSVWLEVVWLTLWAGRIVAKMIPWPLGLISSLFTNNSKKWRDMGKQLEVPATIFFWWLGIVISFLPTMTNHHANHNKATKSWEVTMNKVLISLFVGATLNFIEKIIIQLIAISFHLRTYADRIDLNKFQIGSLTKLYTFSKQKITAEDSDFEEEAGVSRPGSGARTPMAYVDKAQKATKEAINKVGDVAGVVAGDFTGKAVAKSTHPQQVVLTLLNTTGGSQVLARRLYRTFVRDDFDTVFSGDLKSAFDNEDEAEAAFSMFDKDMNGDISIEELESVCVEIGRERKSITASLKDLDSVVSKLDDVLFFVVLVITTLVMLSLISTSAAGVLTSAGSAVLALSWLFAATAQEFLQSVIFVFVKHPFDVGDRVSIYGNTGSSLKGDDYFVKEISLLYTEFKKMEGHVVQAPNSYLNTLFILNMRRSGGLAEAVPVTVKFGTNLQQIDDLRQRLLEFVRVEKREYQGNILTELRDITEAYSITLNVVFFYKSNWQNELLRLQRRNKFICAMMVSMQELGIEGPRMRHPGQKEDSPLYLSYHGAPPQYTPAPQDPKSKVPMAKEQPIVPTASHSSSHSTAVNIHPSILRNRDNTTTGRARGESISAMSKRVDFSLGMKDVSSSDLMGDVYEDRSRTRATEYVLKNPENSTSNAGSTSRERTINEEDEPLDSLHRGSLSSSAHRLSTSSAGMGPSQLRRVSTSSEADRLRSNHLNRFFGRHRGSHNSGGNNAEREDLMEQGMADITEVIDPRSGTVTPVAVQRDSGNTEPVRFYGSHAQPVGTSQTQDFEMRRLGR